MTDPWMWFGPVSVPVNCPVIPPPFSNWKMSDTSGGLVAVGGLKRPPMSTAIGTSTPIAEPLPTMASPCCDKVIVPGDTTDAESSDHAPATDGSCGDVLDWEHASTAPRAMAQTRNRTGDLQTKGIRSLHHPLGRSFAVAPVRQGSARGAASADTRAQSESGACSAATFDGATPVRLTAATTSSTYSVGARRSWM